MTEATLPKFVTVAQAVEDQIRRGQWKSGRVPSVRGVARTHGVSIVTASRALQVLRDSGLIHTVERSGCFLAGQGPRTGERFALCLRVTPGQWQRAADGVTRRGFEATFQRLGLTLEYDTFDLVGGASDRDLVRQARRAVAAGVRGLFFMPARVSEVEMRRDERLLAACRTAQLAVVLIERNLRGAGRPLEYDLVASDDVGGSSLLTRHLSDHGCKRVACIVASPISTHDDRIAGYLAAQFVQAGGRNGHAPLVFHEQADMPRKAATSRLADELLAAGADGAVCYSDYTAVGLIVELFARGVRVPRDFALAGFDDLPIGNQFAVGVSTYALPVEEMARQAVRLLRLRIQNPADPPVKVVVPGRLIVRESSGGQ